MHRAQFNLRGRQERADANFDDEAALDAFGNFAGYGGVLFVGLFDPFPNAAAMRAGVGQEDIAIFLRVQTLDFDGLTFAKFDRAAGFEKFLRRDQAFEFSADVDDYTGVGDGDHVAVENFAFGNDRLRSVELLHQLVHRFVALAGFGGRVRRCRTGNVYRRNLD